MHKFMKPLKMNKERKYKNKNNKILIYFINYYSFNNKNNNSISILK